MCFFFFFFFFFFFKGKSPGKLNQPKKKKVLNSLLFPHFVSIKSLDHWEIENFPKKKKKKGEVFYSKYYGLMTLVMHITFGF